MRIALLHYTCPPIVGGVERVVAEQARLLARRGHSVTVLCGAGEESALRGGEGDESLELILLPELQASPGDLAAGAEEGLLEKLLPLLRTQRVVLLHNVLTMPFHLPLTQVLWRCAELLPQVRFVGWIHDLAATNSEYSHLFQVADSPWELLRKAHPDIEYVAVSAGRREEFLRMAGASRCRCIPNGIDPTEHLRLAPQVRRLAEEWRLLERPLVLLHPARLLRRKNLEASLAVIAALRAEEVEGSLGSVLLLTGARDPHRASSQLYAQELRRYIREHRLEGHVCWASSYGEIGPAELAGLYTVADALYFPSRQEGFGLPPAGGGPASPAGLLLGHRAAAVASAHRGSHCLRSHDGTVGDRARNHAANHGLASDTQPQDSRARVRLASRLREIPRSASGEP